MNGKSVQERNAAKKTIMDNAILNEVKKMSENGKFVRGIKKETFY